MAGRRVLRIGAEGGADGPGEGLHRLGSRAGSRAGRLPPGVSYFLGKTPVWPVPPQKTLVPTRSFWPRPEHFRQRRYEPL
jgi:hypothetical protein